MRLRVDLENIGLLAVRWPRLTAGLLALIGLLSLYGLSQVTFNSDLREIYRTDSVAYENFSRLANQYPTSDNDILLLVEGPTLLGRQTLAKLRALYLELRFVDGVKEVEAVFSARTPPLPDKPSRLLIPSRIPPDAALADIARQLHAHPTTGGALLARDGRTALFVIRLEPDKRTLPQFRDLVARIQGAVDTAAGDGFRLNLTGFPVMRLEIIDELFRNQFLFMGIALALSLFICFAILRSPRLVFLAVTPTALAMLMLFGAMALMGQEVNVLTNVVPVLVSVIALADSLHLLFGIQRHLQAGQSLESAVRVSIVEIGPACVLTSVTTVIALSSLMLVPHGLISGFGLAAAVGVVLAFLSAIIGVPALSMLFLKRWAPKRGREMPLFYAGARRLNVGIAGLVARRPALIAWIGVVLLVVCGSLYFQNQPRYVYREYLPTNNPAHEALRQIDARLAGTSNMRVVLQWAPGSPGRDLFSKPSLEALAKVEQLLAGVPWVRKTWSLHGLVTWIASAGVPEATAVAQLSKVANRLEGRLLSTDAGSTMVVAQFPDRNASELLPMVRRLEAELKKIEAATPGLSIYLTGISTIAASSMAEMIDRLNRSLLLSILVIVLMIGLTTRSALASLVSIVPNLLPIVTAGALLWIAGAGFQAASVVAFVIGFGIAVDSTIHMLNYHRLARMQGQPVPEAVRLTLVAVGPVILMTTLVLVIGIGSTISSAMPTLQVYGMVSVTVILVALVSDLVLLPASLILISRFANRRLWFRA